MADIQAADTEPGDIELRYLDGALHGVAYRCPGCGKKDWISTDPELQGWQIVSEEPLTLRPSVLHKPCGWHGYLDGGRWRRV